MRSMTPGCVGKVAKVAKVTKVTEGVVAARKSYSAAL